MHLKKTIFAWIFGGVILALGLFWAVFGCLDINKLFAGAEYSYTVNEIKESCINNGINMESSIWIAQADDAYFTIELPRKGRILAINIYITEISDSNVAQIYYSPSDEMKSDCYWEIQLKEGSNNISITNSDEIKNIRFDLTDAQGEKVSIKFLEIITTNEHKFQYLIITPILIILYMFIVFCYINKQFIFSQISKCEKLKEKYDLMDQIIALAISDFKSRFSGSYLGIFWGIIQPLSTILLFWFVFQVGFRSNPIDDVPFILWLVAGMIPWNFFNDAWLGGTSAFTAYNYIVKKVVFKLEVLPLVRILSASILNLIFNGILVIIYCIYGRFMGLHIFDMLYFSTCLLMLTLGLSYVTATLNVFMKDVGQFMGIIIQVLMWMTPLMWSYEMIPDSMSWFYKFNPLHYILNGYRESLISGRWFFYHWKQMIWFWIFTLLVFFVGRKMMIRMKDHFADVL